MNNEMTEQCSDSNEYWMKLTQLFLIYMNHCWKMKKISPHIFFISEEISDEETNGYIDIIYLTISLQYSHRLNMELDLKSLFGLLCTAVLTG
jgi:hypothetical protein